ncbi:hypothetical protein [Rhodospirillum sp. A1_3_36]|uniref:hypothetical protein n=1 Tax=Rhodospirillum sp. A1_3_36 TaxID=3391666 RepID=UPI0039A535A3
MKKYLKIGLIVIVLLLVVGGGVVAGIKFGFIPDFLGLSPPEAPVEEPKALSPLERLGQPPFLISLNPIEIPVISNGQIIRRCSFAFRVQIEPEDTVEVRHLFDKLQSKILEDLMVFLPRNLETRDTVDLMAVKQRMRRVAEQVMGPGKVKDVLIQGYFER